MKRRRRPFDPRQHWGQTQVRLILGGLALLVVVGGGLAWLFYGRAAAITVVTCLLAAGGLLGLLWLILALLERWVKEEDPR